MKHIFLILLSIALAATGTSAQAGGRHGRHNLYHNIDHHGTLVIWQHRGDHYRNVNQRLSDAWVSKGRYRTRKHESANRHIAIGGRISAIRITSARRSTYIREAWVEYGNGRLERIPALEGRLSLYNPVKVRFHSRHNIRKLHLKVNSSGHHRGYFDVDVRRVS